MTSLQWRKCYLYVAPLNTRTLLILAGWLANAIFFIYLHLFPLCSSLFLFLTSASFHSQSFARTLARSPSHSQCFCFCFSFFFFIASDIMKPHLQMRKTSNKNTELKHKHIYWEALCSLCWCYAPADMTDIIQSAESRAQN